MTLVQPVEVPAGVDPGMAGAVSLTARAIPVGGTSRDFTAVVDMTPTASREVGGIRLGGSTGAESRYVVDAAHITAPAFGTVASSVIDPPLALGFVAVEPHARARVREVRAGTARATRCADSCAQAEPLARGFTDGERRTYRIHRKLVLVILRGADGGLAHFEVRTRHELGDAITRCLRGQIAGLLHTLRPGRRAEVELSVWMRL